MPLQAPSTVPKGPVLYQGILEPVNADLTPHEGRKFSIFFILDRALDGFGMIVCPVGSFSRNGQDRGELADDACGTSD